MEQKKIKFITATVADNVEKFFQRSAEKIIAKSGYDLKIGAVGGRYNKERMVIEIGLLPTDAAEHRFSDLAEDMNTNNSMRKNVNPKLVSKLAKYTKQPKKKIRRYVEGWYNAKEQLRPYNLKIGSRLSVVSMKFRIIGFDLKKNKFVLYFMNDTEENKRIVVVSPSKVLEMDVL